MILCEDFKQHKELKIGKYIFGHYEVAGTKYINGHASDSSHKVDPKAIYVLGHIHCFSEDAEFLTEKGWKYFDDLDNLKVATLKSGLIEFQKPLEYIKEPYTGDLVQINSKNISAKITPNHRLLYSYKRNHPYRFRPASDLLESSIGGYYPIAGYRAIKPYPLTENELRLIVWICADGSTLSKYSDCRWHLKKPRKIKRLKKLLSDLKIRYKEYFCKDGTVKIDLYNEGKFYNVNPDFKQLPEFFRKLSIQQAHVVLEEYAHTDGNFNNNTKTNIQISTAKKFEADLIQELCILSGCSCNLNKRSGHFYLFIRLDNTMQSTQAKDSVSKVDYSGSVVCLRTPNETLVTRQNGKVLISGNSPDCSFKNVNYVGSVYKVTASEIGDTKRIAIITDNKLKFYPIESRPMYEIELNGLKGKLQCKQQKFLKELEEGSEIDLKIKVITDTQTLPSIHKSIQKIKEKFKIEYYRQEITLLDVKVNIPDNLDQKALGKTYCKQKNITYALIEKELDNNE